MEVPACFHAILCQFDDHNDIASDEEGNTHLPRDGRVAHNETVQRLIAYIRADLPRNPNYVYSADDTTGVLGGPSCGVAGTRRN